MQRGEIDLVIVAATARWAAPASGQQNRHLHQAVLAKRHGIPFYVAIPLSTMIGI